MTTTHTILGTPILYCGAGQSLDLVFPNGTVVNVECTADDVSIVAMTGRVLYLDAAVGGMATLPGDVGHRTVKVSFNSPVAIRLGNGTLLTTVADPGVGNVAYVDGVELPYSPLVTATTEAERLARLAAAAYDRRWVYRPAGR